jgi:acyl carrier protein
MKKAANRGNLLHNVWGENMDSQVGKEIISIIADVSGFDPEEIRPDANFFKDLDIDSIKAIEITVAIEKKFKIKVRDEDVPKLTTVRQAIELVDELLNQTAPAERVGLEQNKVSSL